MRTPAAVILAVFAFLGGCATAEPRPRMATADLALMDSETAYARASTEDRNRIVCMRETVIGSNRPQRVCMTLAERDAIREQARINRDRMGQRTQSCTEPIAVQGGCPGGGL